MDREAREGDTERRRGSLRVGLEAKRVSERVERRALQAISIHSQTLSSFYFLV